MIKCLVFDMDGTIADLYKVENWLEKIKTNNPEPYEIAPPMWDMEILTNTLNLLKTYGWMIIITSWLAKNSTKDYDEKVRKAKKAWLEKYNFPYDEIHIVKYGTTKADCTRKHGGYQILIDDTESVRKGWNLGDTINPVNEDILKILSEIVSKEANK